MNFLAIEETLKNYKNNITLTENNLKENPFDNVYLYEESEYLQDVISDLQGIKESINLTLGRLKSEKRLYDKMYKDDEVMVFNTPDNLIKKANNISLEVDNLEKAYQHQLKFYIKQMESNTLEQKREQEEKNKEIALKNAMIKQAKKAKRVQRRERANKAIKKMMFGAAVAFGVGLAIPSSREVIIDNVLEQISNVNYNPKIESNLSAKKDVIDLNANDDIDLNTSDYLLLKAIESDDYEVSEDILKLSTAIPHLVKEYNNSNDDIDSITKYSKSEEVVLSNSTIIQNLSMNVINEKMSDALGKNSSFTIEREEENNFLSEHPRINYYLVDINTGQKYDLGKNELNLPNEVEHIVQLIQDTQNREEKVALDVSDENHKGKSAKNLANIIYLTKELDKKVLERSEDSNKVKVIGIDESKEGYTKLNEDQKFEKISKYNQMVVGYKENQMQLEEYERYKYDEHNTISDFIVETDEKLKKTAKEDLDIDFEI